MKQIAITILVSYILYKVSTAKLERDLEHEKSMRDLEKLRYKNELKDYQERLLLLQNQIEVFRRAKND
jgi:hypothetical protein